MLAPSCTLRTVATVGTSRTAVRTRFFLPLSLPRHGRAGQSATSSYTPMMGGALGTSRTAALSSGSTLWLLSRRNQDGRWAMLVLFCTQRMGATVGCRRIVVPANRSFRSLLRHCSRDGHWAPTAPSCTPKDPPVNGVRRGGGRVPIPYRRVARVSRSSRPGDFIPDHVDSVLSITARGRAFLLLCYSACLSAGAEPVECPSPEVSRRISPGSRTHETRGTRPVNNASRESGHPAVMTRSKRHRGTPASPAAAQCSSRRRLSSPSICQLFSPAALATASRD